MDNKNIGKKLVLTKVSNVLKGEIQLLRDNHFTKEQVAAEADTIYKLMLIINNFDALDPFLEKWFREKHEKDKEDR